MTYIFGDLGRSWSIFRDLGSKGKILLGSRGNYFQGSGEINALLGAQTTPPPGGPQRYLLMKKKIVRPANRDWACQTERCHTLSNKTSLQYIGCNSLCTLYSCNQLKRRRVDDKGDQLYTLACLVNFYLQSAAGNLLHFIFWDGYVLKVFGDGSFALFSNSVCMAKLV